MDSAILALTRPVSPSIVNCELTHLAREPIDWRRAVRQHDEYEELLRTLGCTVQRLDAPPDHPDAVFIEDTAVVLNECAIVARPGAAARRGETAGIADALRPYRRVFHIEAPGTLDGGDVLLVGQDLFVGMSSRSNADGARQLADVVAGFGYAVQRVPMRDCLHLKTAVSTLPDERLLLDARRVDPETFGGAEWIECIADEEVGANVLVVDETVVCPQAAPRTHERLESEGYEVVTVNASELAKAEGGLTCCSLLLRI
jgi:dimethylargininase